MHYHEPASLERALALLADDADARCIAGGATLVAMLNADLLKPSALISLKAIPALKGILAVADGFAIGAMTSHQAVASDARLQAGAAVVRLAAGEIGHPAIRAVGTIGGSISHADPAADYPTALVAANAQIEIASLHGRRRVPAHEFFVSYYTTAIEPGEIVVAVHLAAPTRESVSAYRKVGRCDGDFATASVAFSGAFVNGACISASVAVGGCGATPVRSVEANALLVGAQVGSSQVIEAAEALVAACDPVDDVRGSANYRRQLVRRLVPQVFAQAAQGGVAH
ncbi:MAG: xanthine dehydrogenase family protein subunit M [Bradyrhizobium sp.]